MRTPNPLRRLLRPALAAVALAAAPEPALAQHEHSHAQHRHAPATPVAHPEPRPGVTAEHVLPPERFQRERHREAYRNARAIPEILDGLFCHCDCHDRKGLRSLLSCFETDMAASCGICQGQARLAYRLHREGKSLDEIRAAVDREFGG